MILYISGGFRDLLISVSARVKTTFQLMTFVILATFSAAEGVRPFPRIV